jgi:hypothetical protein
MVTIRQPQILSVKECPAAEEYRAKADECRTIARQISLSNDRMFILDMATGWDRLADEAEKDQ